MKLESSESSTILIVDDKLDNLKLLTTFLRQRGFELMVAQSGEETLKHVERIIPDIILLDVMMPGIDGFKTCRCLKEDKTTKDIPVIFMTALTDTVDKVKGFEMGAVDYLTKPLQHEEVLARVNAHLTIRKFQRQLQEQNDLLQQNNALLEKQKLELQESEARFHGLSEATFEGILIHDKGRIIDGNQTLEKMFGYKRSEVIGKNILDYLSPGFRDQVQGWMRTNDGNPYEAEGIRKDGSLFPLEVQAKTMPYQGHDVRVVAIRDLTWRKAMEEEKVRLQKENLTFSMDTLGFVTHELKSPLAAMQSLIMLMLEGYTGDLPDKISPYLLRIRRNCEELQDMVKNYLDLSRFGMGELVARKRPVNFYKEIVEPCLEHAQILFKSREVTPAVDCPEDVTVQADYELLRVALTNYLTNAAKYGAENTQVRLTVREDQGELTTTVWNKGAGFRPEEQALLFAKFSRLENKNTSRNRGSGLGLYLTKQIIELHNGKVWAESVPDQWAKFCFSFPLNTLKKKSGMKS
jgi:PAS domain S-box-containing protein